MRLPAANELWFTSLQCECRQTPKRGGEAVEKQDSWRSENLLGSWAACSLEADLCRRRTMVSTTRGSLAKEANAAPTQRRVCKIWAWRLNWLLIIILNSTSKQPFALSPIEIQTLESSAGLETIMNGNVKSTCLHEWSFYRFRGKGWENVITSRLLVNIYPSSRRLIRPFSSNVGGRLAARKNVTAASPLQTLSGKSEMLKNLHLAHSVVALWDMWPFNGRAFCTHSSKTVLKTKRFEHLQHAFRRTFHCKRLLERSFSPQQTGSTFNASVFSFY